MEQADEKTRTKEKELKGLKLIACVVRSEVLTCKPHLSKDQVTSWDPGIAALGN